MVMLQGHDGHVKVKSAELKAKLSGYLRQIRESGESVEVLIERFALRETPSMRRDDRQSGHGAASRG